MEFRNTRPDLLPQEDKLILENMNINGSRFPSRSVSGDLNNGGEAGILRNSKNSRDPNNIVSWSEVVDMKVRRTKT